MQKKTVDPYYEWLGIPPKDQPPNHYRLLGLELFEENRNVIDAAANRQMSFIKEYEAGADSELSQKLLNELSAARLCLLSPTAKAAYDEQLRAKRMATATPPAAVSTTSSTRWRSESDSPCPASDGFAPASRPASAVPIPVFPDLDRKPASPPARTPRPTVTARRSQALRRSTVGLGAWAVAAALLAGILALVLFVSLRPKSESALDAGAEGPPKKVTKIGKPESSVAASVATPVPPAFSPPPAPSPVQQPPQAVQPAPVPTELPVVTPEVKPPAAPVPPPPVSPPPAAKPEETLEQAEQRLKVAAERASSPAEHRAVAEESLALAKRAVSNSQRELGRRVAERALAAARQSESGELVRQATLLWSELQ